MGIAEEIRKNLQERIIIKYRTDAFCENESLTCEICTKSFSITGTLCLYIKDDGYICPSCAERFAPEITALLARFESGTDLKQKKTEQVNTTQVLTYEEWREVHGYLQMLLKTTAELAKGISRGIVEAPAGHIGLLHFAKDIVKPVRKESESEKDYQLRIKSYRMSRICEKIKNETTERLLVLQDYLLKMGMPRFPDSES